MSVAVPQPVVWADQTAQAATTPFLRDLRSEHQHVLDELNVKDPDGKVMELDDERVPGLLKKGWKLAGAWAAGYVEAHPTASRRELERIFEDFAPKPQAVKSQYGNFLEYSEYSFEGRAV